MWLMQVVQIVFAYFKLNCSDGCKNFNQNFELSNLTFIDKGRGSKIPHFFVKYQIKYEGLKHIKILITTKYENLGYL